MSAATARLQGTSSAAAAAFPWLIFLPFALLPVVGENATNVDRIILLVQASMLYMGLRRPMWILAALLVSELTIANYMHEIGSTQVSNRLLLSVAAVPLLAPHVMDMREPLGPRSRWMVVSAVVFVLIACLANYAAEGTPYTVKFARYLFTCLVALALPPLVIRNHEDLRDVAIVGLVVTAISAACAILQHYSQFTSLPAWQTVPHAGVPGPDFEGWGGRSLGLTENPIYISSAIMFAAMPLLGVILIAPLPSRVRAALTVVLALSLTALFFSFTRSWTYSFALGVLAMGLLARGNYQREFWLILIVGGAAFFYYSDAQNNRYNQDASTDSSAATRPVLWSAAYAIANDHPILGVGHDSFLELALQYADRVDKALLERNNAGSALGVYQPHNDFLNVWLSFGIIGLLSFITIHLLAIASFIESYLKANDGLVRGLALGGVGAVLAFAANAFFHNLFDSTLVIWLLAGFSMALAKLALTDNEPSPERIETDFWQGADGVSR